MIKIGQRWKRIGLGFNTGSDPKIFIIEIVSLQGGGAVKARAVQDGNRCPRDIRGCDGLPTTSDYNEFWMLLEGQEAPCS